ncbi:MAG: tail fiber domain-containing protein, partial [Verrucomicrobiaceae bacterium]
MLPVSSLADVMTLLPMSAKLDTGSIGLWTPTGSNVYRNGNVGIGEINPGFPLNFGSALGDKISLFSSSGANYGFGVQSNLLQIHTSAQSADINFGYGSSGSMIETMRIRGNGNVGIGTANPVAKLDILGSVQLNGTAGRNYFKDGVKSDGLGLRVGEAWGKYGIYAETGMGVVGGAGGTSLQGDALVVNTAANVGIGTASPVSRLNVAENPGTTASPNTGTLLIDHWDAGGASSIVFRSTTNRGSDYGYIQYQDASTVGGGGESAKLVIGIQNDADDDILLSPSGKVGVKTTTLSEGTLNVGGALTSVGSWNNAPGYARMYYDGGRILLEAFNTNINNGQWRGFSMDGNNDLDWRSDRRLKKDIVDAEPMLERLMQLPFRRYRWRDTADENVRPEFGV